MSTDNSQSGGQDYDFVPCYAEIAHVSIASNVARIWLKGRTEDGVYANPILFAAWQRMKDEYPRYAYSGFDRRADDGNANQSLSSAVQAIFSAFSNLSELTEKFYSKARRNSYACQLDTLNKSFVRIAKIDGHKLGGGARVSKVRISDDWQDMTGANDRFYGQAYDYTTTEGGQTVSSGVASYEPTVGNDENPFRMPVPYVQHIKGGLDEFFDLEEPFGESFFPSPSVVYSKVTVTDLDKDGNPDSDIRTGYIVNEFYTAKDFPVKVTVLPMQKFESKSNTKYTLTETSATDELCLSQGYAIELNDMHGKAKATRVFNHSRSEISSTVYYYNTTPDGTGQKLSNVVKIVNPDGTISSNKVIGRDVEFFTDFRQQETRNDGNTINIGGDIIPAFFIPLPIPHWPTGNNTEFKRFRSACGVKLSQYYGIVDRVVKTQNGSSITTQNIAYDGLTGEALVTRTQNEFKKDIYSVNMPAYWVYPRMGGAYHDSGMMLSDFRTDFHGALYNYDYYLQPGDVLADLAGSALYWVIETPYPPNPSIKTKKLVDVHGKLKKSFTPSMIKIVRSAFKNMLGASTSSVVCLNNPITYDASLNKEVLQLRNNSDLTALKVINASANTFDEAWSATPPCHPYLDPLLTNTSHCFNFCAPSTSSVYNESGTRILSNPWNSYTGNNELTGALWGESDNATQSVDDPLVNGATTQDFSLNSPNTGICTSRDDESCSTSYNYGSTPSHANWPLVRSGIWSCTPVSNNLNEVIGFDTCVNNATQVAKTYFFGFAADNYIEIYIDGGRVFSSSNYMYWTITPYQLLPGKHAVHVEFYNKCVDGADNSNNPAIVGLEIYDNTITQLKNAQNLSDLNVIFSTQGLRGASVQSFRTISGQKVYHYTNADYSIPGVCDKVTARVNPYIEGYLGNWRPYQTKVFQQGRSYNNIFNPAMKGIDVKNAGYIQNFSPHWYYSNTQAKWLKSNAPRWVTANTVTLYDKYGQQLENKDALGRYSAAKFDFYGELPSAVASNAMNREIYAGSFEDNKFRPGSANADTCNSSGEFYNTSGVSIRHLIDSTQSHSGNYCAVIPSGDGVVLNTLVHNVQQKTLNYLTFNDQYEYYAATSMGIVPKGFEPNPGKKYIFNTWIKDDQPTDKSYVGIDLVINNSIHPALTCKAIVEGWKLIEGTIDLRAVSSGTNLSIAIKSTSDLNVLIDDIRMHPVDSHMKTYAYDDKTMRLMAEIDENGFATFYEYDSEGLLIRVKKETERGVMTLKESRSSYKKRLP
jgi:hypothetical protein